MVDLLSAVDLETIVTFFADSVNQTEDQCDF